MCMSKKRTFFSDLEQMKRNVKVRSGKQYSKLLKILNNKLLLFLDRFTVIVCSKKANLCFS